MFRKYRLVPAEYSSSDYIPTNLEVTKGPPVGSDKTAPIEEPTPVETKTSDEQFSIQDVLNATNPALKHHVEGLLDHLEGNVQVNPENLRVIYPDSVEGSPLPKLLDWFLDEEDSRSKPWDAGRFVKLMESLQIPQSYFGKSAAKETTSSVGPVSAWERIY